MKRRLFTGIWVLSLMMSVAMVAWWVRSYFRGDLFGRLNDIVEERDELDRWCFVASNFGRLRFAYFWTQSHYDVMESGLKTRKEWVCVTRAPQRHLADSAYFSRNLDTPTARYRSRGFDLKIISSGHFTTYSWWRNNWSNQSNWAMTVPHWLVTLVFLILPATALRRGVRWRRRRRLVEDRRCPHCGYDLRASGECCPECGKPVEAAAVKVSL